MMMVATIPVIFQRCIVLSFIHHAPSCPLFRIRYLLDAKPGAFKRFCRIDTDHSIFNIYRKAVQGPRSRGTNDVSFDIEKEELSIETTIEGDMETTMNFLGFIMSKLRGILITETEFERIYEVSTRKGKADVSINLTDGGRVRILISGYGDALGLIREKIESEIRYFKEV